ncbi:unnamed protein product (macronuclear) [Paramecium tetraurelia]|uniref:Uncharacterized protein n=1 Tax=Paramecium tetraurelia TaxID=5888 RepID=A0EI03_PARTE|nr:uncharacterized protein GSPATT00027271001 [Paramecium tetraurelia]CAK94944.1 unnamed protein product [Paramecium tetraurelia]|eukprot:XP_001462317.1 hypothetical protein (macronuclear) [Paramecium tetraurelia strain d4-2]
MKKQSQKEEKRVEPKVGLLGTYDNLTREQLIEKLLVTEEILKKLYKENKELKEMINKQQN